ncbi:Retinol dehydrogenase 13 [Caenorhabditis elegans]|uniref:Retinol dehydrogenase 13 n=1 Tax=Caenorhabditis elegans TaxID=6239 RepID=Q9U1Y6_CAEEL|nr:Retinol dehydrogenase 13 [Caenorhabditis elegans]CAB60405.3 Retinol dehydrogenase 13 [Caenorhabditis elegans]|eukprot:NP_507860.3 DeHydrogenases, Short chain [Caenorhabditis elegans]
MAGRRLIQGLTSPWSVGFSAFGLAYGGYHVWDSTQSGTKYDLHEDLAGKTYIVTGATSGIGQATAEELAKRNARVIMACRNREKCVQVRRDIVLNTRNKQVYCRQCDLEDFDSIRTFVQKLSKGKFELDRIDGIVHNAAMMQSERAVNKDGIEKTIATNHLGSFLLTGLLLDKLLAQPNPVRIVFLNSNIIDRKCDLNLADFNSENAGKKFDGYEIYKHSKLASALFTKELSERLSDTNIHVLMADPGRTKSNLSAQMDGQTFFLSRWLLKIVSFGMGERRTEKAVRPVLFALCDPDTSDENGLFIDRERHQQPWNDVIMDAAKREKLWNVSVTWTRLGEHLKKMKEELGEAAAIQISENNTPTIESATAGSGGGRSWKTLWLW